MRLKHDADVQANEVSMDGAADTTIQILVGPDDGSDNIVMRLFRIMPGGHTPYHVHDFEHVVRVQSGKGIARDKDGNEHPLSHGQSVFVPANEKHQFANPADAAEPFEVLCIILNAGAC